MLKKLFDNKIFIKGFYICGLLIWTLALFHDATAYPFLESAVGIQYAYLFWPPTIALTLHLLINSKLTWGLVFLCYNLLVILYIKEYIIDDFNSYHGGEKDYMNSATSYILTGIVTTIIFFIDWTIYKTRPKNEKHSI
jgi:hypothetical protein